MSSARRRRTPPLESCCLAERSAADRPVGRMWRRTGGSPDWATLPARATHFLRHLEGGQVWESCLLGKRFAGIVLGRPVSRTVLVHVNSRMPHQAPRSAVRTVLPATYRRRLQAAETESPAARMATWRFGLSMPSTRRSGRPASTRLLCSTACGCRDTDFGVSVGRQGAGLAAFSRRHIWRWAAQLSSATTGLRSHSVIGSRPWWTRGRKRISS